jgi:hypothetical protein
MNREVSSFRHVSRRYRPFAATRSAAGAPEHAHDHCHERMM